MDETPLERVPALRCDPPSISETPAGDTRLESDMFLGPVGEWVRDATPHTEADPVALLVSALVVCGVSVGRGPHFFAGDARQTASLFGVIVAETPKANRGLSWAVTNRLLVVMDPELASLRVATGLGNGRTLVDSFAALGTGVRGRSVPAMVGGSDRLLVYEPGFTRALGVTGRPSSKLPLVIRSAWDGQPLEHRRTRVERHHVGIVAHATADQLARRLSLTAASASLVNRFLFVLAHRQRPLVDEGNVPVEIILEHGRRLRSNLALAANFGHVPRSRDAEERWRSAYQELAADDPGGLVGIIVARAARHTLRLALVYALVEASPRVEVEHLDAALALWSYCRQSAAVICASEPTGPEDLASGLFSVIAAAGEQGLTLTEQLNSFGRNVPAGKLRVARQILVDTGRVVSTRERRSSVGRPVTVTRVIPRRGGAPVDS